MKAQDQRAEYRSKFLGAVRLLSGMVLLFVVAGIAMATLNFAHEPDSLGLMPEQLRERFNSASKGTFELKQFLRNPDTGDLESAVTGIDSSTSVTAVVRKSDNKLSSVTLAWNPSIQDSTEQERANSTEQFFVTFCLLFSAIDPSLQADGQNQLMYDLRLGRNFAVDKDSRSSKNGFLYRTHWANYKLALTVEAEKNMVPQNTMPAVGRISKTAITSHTVIQPEPIVGSANEHPMVTTQSGDAPTEKVRVPSAASEPWTNPSLQESRISPASPPEPRSEAQPVAQEENNANLSKPAVADLVQERISTEHESERKHGRILKLNAELVEVRGKIKANEEAINRKKAESDRLMALAHRTVDEDDDIGWQGENDDNKKLQARERAIMSELEKAGGGGTKDDRP